MAFFDSHAHLTCDAVYDDVEGLLERANRADVKRIANICTDPLTLERGLLLHEQFPWVYNVGATTPHDVEKEGVSAFPVFEKAARSGQLVAVGETGLDYYYEHSNKTLQQEFLKRYFELALETKLPIVIHCRDAFDDLFRLSDSYYSKDAELILHCFTGNIDEAKEVIKRQWCLSLSGIVTFKRSEELREVSKIVPNEQLLIETDTPYLAPIPYRGKQNEPAYVVETAKCIAKQRGMSLADLARSTTQNAARIFRIEITI